MEARDFGVRAAMVLLFDKGRGFGVDCMFCTCESGGFLIVEGGRAMADVLLGVAEALGVKAALALRFPGAVIDPLWEGAASFLGVVGVAWGVPSLVMGRLPFDSAEAGRRGGG